jgi:hypothetical protein
MKKTIYFILFLFITGTLMADWDITESHGMHYPQMPDPTGYDVDCNDPRILADDFLCTQSGPIREIHIWISQRYQTGEPIPPPILNIYLSIHTDIPAAGSPTGYSIPGELLWSDDFGVGQFIIREPAYEGLQGWFDPWIPELWLGDHIWYWQVTPFESLDMAFVIGGDDYPKPVELSSFTTLYANGNAILNWTTQSETNNLGWNIYRGETENALENNTTFCLNNSGLIPGAGTTTEPTNYQFTDEYDVIVNQTYWYWLETVDGGGNTDNYGPVTLTIPEEEPVPVLPQNTFLCSNYPNPFNPSTFIEFSIKEGETGKLTIYNTKGQVIETRTYEAGSDYYKWDGTEYGSGIYFYKLETQSYTETKKMIMLK